MKIGLTYDLRQDYLERGFGLEETAEFDSRETLDAIADALRRLGHRPERIGGARALQSTLLEDRRWDLVFNIAEGLRGVGRESLVPSLLDEYEIPYTFSDPMVLALCLHKGMCKHVIRDLGLATPRFRIVRRMADLRNLDLDFPVFAKPVSEGTGKGIGAASVIGDGVILGERCEELLGRFEQPVLVEEYLPGREYTVGIVGTGHRARCLGILEVHFNPDVEPIYSYETKAHYEDRVSYTLATGFQDVRAIEKLALAAWRGLDCRDGGRIDIRLDGEGVPNFIEVNPLAGLNPTHSDLPILCGLVDWSYDDLIAAIVESARERVLVENRRTA